MGSNIELSVAQPAAQPFERHGLSLKLKFSTPKKKIIN